MSDEFVMSEEIEALAATLNDALENFYEPFDWHEATRISARILAAGYRKPRTITTVEELDTLPVGSIIHMSNTKAPFLFTGDGWESTRNPGKPVWDYTSNPGYLPATVLYTPEPLP